MFKPLNNRVLVEPENWRKNHRFWYYSYSQRRKADKWNCCRGEQRCKKGDKIIFSKFGYDEVKIEDKLYYIVSDFNILGVF